MHPIAGASIETVFSWLIPNNEATFIYPDFPRVSYKTEHRPGRLELFYDGSKLNGYLSNKEPFKDVVTFTSYGEKSAFADHSLTRAWAPAVLREWLARKGAAVAKAKEKLVERQNSSQQNAPAAPTKKKSKNAIRKASRNPAADASSQAATVMHTHGSNAQPDRLRQMYQA